MADPLRFSPSYDFSDFEENQPASPKPGVQLDAQFDDIAQASTEAVNALLDIRNPDGTLRDGIVTKDSLSVDLKGQLAVATASSAAAAQTARDEAVGAASVTVAARDEAGGYSSNLDAIYQALQNGDYVQDDGLITEPATKVIDYGLITDPAD
jgi:hypothetical protein